MAVSAAELMDSLSRTAIVRAVLLSWSPVMIRRDQDDAAVVEKYVDMILRRQ